MTFTPAESLQPIIETAPQKPNWGLRILGFLLFLPAAFSCALTLLLPHLQTLTLSRTNYNMFKEPDFIGSENFDRLFADPIYQNAVNFTVLLIIERIIIVAIVPIVLALAANALGRIARISTRLLFSIPLALFAPVFIYLSWRLVLSTPPLNQQNMLTNPQTAPVALATIDGLVTFGLACGFGLIAYFIALRGTGRGAPRWRETGLPLLIVWVVSIFTAIATALQTFTINYVMTQGGPANATTTIFLYFYKQSFQFLKIGMGSAVASVILVILTAMGIIVGLLVVTSGLRMETVPANKPTSGAASNIKILSAVVLILMLLISLFLLWSDISPQLRVFSGEALGPFVPPKPAELPPNMPEYFSSTTMPTLIGLLTSSLPFVLLAAFGIGALRPLGRFSEWLLLPFSPWLFITIMPLSTAYFAQMKEAGLLNTPAALQVGSALLNVPILFILTLFFKGQERKFRATGSTLMDFIRIVLLPAVPLVLLLLCIAVALGQQDYYWQLISVVGQKSQTVPVWVSMLAMQYGPRPDLIASVLRMYGLPLAIVSFLILLPFQIFYLDRLALSTSQNTDRDEQTEKPEQEKTLPDF